MFSNVIVKTPCKAVTEGITSAPQLGKPDYELALKQHQCYIDTLAKLGVTVTVLPADESYPDSCFVEDTAVLTPNCTILTNPGAATRAGETAAMLPILRQFYSDDCIEYINSPGTLEGGDVMMVGNHFYVGKSARTNEAGIKQFLEILQKYGHTGSEIPLTEVLHLKTGVNYIEQDTFLVSGEFLDRPELAGSRLLVIPPEEAYAANCIWVNDTVVVPAGYPKTAALVAGAGFTVATVDTSEFRKIDGGLSCLSLRF